MVPALQQSAKPGGVPRRRAGSELHLHARDAASDRVHRRHPARQPARAPDARRSSSSRRIARSFSRGCSRGSASQRRAEVVGCGPLPRVRSDLDDRRAASAEPERHRDAAHQAARLRALGRRSAADRGHLFSFFWDGPNIRYSSFPAGSDPRVVGRSGGQFGGNFPSYEELMLQTDMEASTAATWRPRRASGG